MLKIITLAILIITTHLGLSQGCPETNLTNDPAEDRYASYSRDGSQILFESNRSGNWDIYLINSDASEVVPLTSDDSDERRPCWHPNSQKILFESNRSGEFELYELEISSKRITKVNYQPADGVPIFAQYSPDGEKIAFSLRISETESRIVITDFEGNVKSELADYGYRSFYPRWSPDGSRLLFFSRHETDNQDDELYTIAVDGSDKLRLTNWPKHNFCPSWAPDSNKIAYATSMENSRPEIFTMDSDGSNQERITFNEDGDTLPDWSPDGTKLLITGYRNGNYEIIELTLKN